MNTPSYQLHGTATIDDIPREFATRVIWQSRLDAIRAREEELTHAHDQLAADRRRGPWLKVERDYLFRGCPGRQPSPTCFRAAGS